MNDAEKRWFRQRITAIHAEVTAYDVLRRNGVQLQQSGDDREEQFSCPFHGVDKKPSARIYPEKDDSPSHVWCFVCQEPRWDAIGLWQKFNNLSLGQAVHRLEREFNLETPEAPDHDELDEAPRVAENKEAFKKAYMVCEARLLACKPAYRMQKDMAGYLTAGSILDRTKARVDTGVWPPEKGIGVLEALRGRIVEKATKCPVG
jgi:CHC2 zinc finger